ncbi:hypothetical protein JCM10212_004475 [Sporobolomyces blumeae]
MFYSPQLLTSRKGGFAIVWLASTIGAKGSGAVRKLSRKELLSCDLVKACEQIVAPEEPLALRLSSNLLAGVARVYQHQFRIYAADVTQFHQALKKSLAGALSVTLDASAQVDLAPPVVPKAVLGPVAEPPQTASGFLVRDAGLALYGFDPDAEAFDGPWFLPGTTPEHVVEDIEIEGSFYSEYRGPPEEHAPARPATSDAFQAREADITLAEPHIQDYMLGREAGDDFATGEQLELGIFGEGERGLLEGHIPELDVALGAASVAGPSTSAGEGYRDDFYAGQEFGGDAEGEGLGGMEEQVFHDYPSAEETLEARVAREHAEGLAERERALAGLQRTPSPERLGASPSTLGVGAFLTPSAASQKRVSDVLADVGQVQEARKKARSKKRISLDRTTEVTDDAFRTMRATYADRMAAERAKAEQEAEAKDAHTRAMDLVFGPPDLFGGPILSDFWKKAVSDQLTPFDGGKAADAKRQFGKRSPPGRRPTPAAFGASPAAIEFPRRAEGLGRLSQEPGRGIGAEGAFDAGQDYGDFYAGQEFGGEGVDLGGMEEQIFVELGRAASPAGALVSQRQSLAPWAGEVATSETGAGFAAGFGAASSHAGTRVSLDQPLPFARTPSLAPSAARLGRPSSPADFGLGPDVPLGDFEEGRLSRASSIISPHPSDLATLEAEAEKFLRYAYRQASTLPAPSPAVSPATGRPRLAKLRFDSLVPPRETSASTAAQAFSHVLSLTMKGLVKVRQEEAYGGIEIELVGGGA